MRLLIAFLLILSGCAKGGDAATTAASSKSLFSIWTDSNGFILDLTAASIGTSTLKLYFATGEKCNCVLDLIGSQAAGNLVMSSCTYQAGTGTSMADPGCALLNNSSTYSKPASVLTICGASCVPFN